MSRPCNAKGVHSLYNMFWETTAKETRNFVVIIDVLFFDVSFTIHFKREDKSKKPQTKGGKKRKNKYMENVKAKQYD